MPMKSIIKQNYISRFPNKQSLIATHKTNESLLFHFQATQVSQLFLSSVTTVRGKIGYSTEHCSMKMNVIFLSTSIESS